MRGGSGENGANRAPKRYNALHRGKHGTSGAQARNAPALRNRNPYLLAGA